MDMERFHQGGPGAVWIGVDIGGTKTAVVLSFDPPAIAARVEFATLPDQGPSRALDRIIKTTRELLNAPDTQGIPLQAIGISCGSPLDRTSGVIQSPPNLSTWVDIPIVSILQREFNVDCRLENDANAGAVAEYRFGAGQGTQHMIFLTMGTGMGAGIIADGRLYRGASDQAGEIGHVRLTQTGPVGYNKAGSVEGWASGGGMAQFAYQEVTSALRNGEESRLAAILNSTGSLTAKDIAVAAQHGDKLAQRIIHSTGLRLGEALAILVDILNPERIVIGGLAMRLGESLLAPAREAMAHEALLPASRICEVVPAALGETIGDVAAICVSMGL
ncbi:MAG TPA: ROK family protein [Acidobacteriaceae bacterium]|nr:ROK family protein [Acidobacteriaceae bacterium]